MNKTKSNSRYMITSIIVMCAIWLFIILEKTTTILNGVDAIIFILIALAGTIALIRARIKDKEIQQGLPSDDEMSLYIKYKSGYDTFIASMYVWLFIFLFRQYFPTIESMLGGGILISAVIFFVMREITKRKMLHEK